MILSPLHRSERTCFHAVPAVQAVLLLNDKRFCRHIDTFLRTFAAADAASAASVRDEISALLPRCISLGLLSILPHPTSFSLRADSQHERIPEDRLHGQIEELSRSFRHLKDFQSCPALLLRVDLRHIRFPAINDQNSYGGFPEKSAITP